MDNLLRKEPTIAPRDDIPVLKDRVNVSWEKLSRVLERVPTVEPSSVKVQEASLSVPPLDERLVAEITRRIVPAVCAQISDQLDDVLTLALNNSYQRMRNDLNHQLEALITECVREETQKVVREQNLG